MMFETYGLPMGETAKGALKEIPEDADWLRAYLERGWEIVDIDGKPMLKYPEDMGTPLHPTDTTPINLHGDIEAPKRKARVRNGRR